MRIKTIFLRITLCLHNIYSTFFLTLSILDLTKGFLPKYVQASELRARNSCMSSLLDVSGMLLNC